MILRHIRKEIGDILVDVLTPNWYIDIIENDTLYTWSEFFPYIIKGIVVRQFDAIPCRHPQTNVLATSFMYKLPKETEDIEYINVEEFFYPGNITQDQTTSNLPALNGMLGMINKSLPNSQYYNIVRYTAIFNPPDIITIDPKPLNHLDFSINMQRKVRLYEVPMYYRRYFLALCAADCKIALFSKFKNLKSGASYQGLEINTDFLSDLSEGKSEREELLNVFYKNSFKDSSRFSSLLAYSE